MFILPEEVVSQPSAKDVLPAHPEILLILSLTEEINPSLSTKTSVTFFAGDARQKSTDGPQDPSVVTSTPITKPKAKQASCGERQSLCIVLEMSKVRVLKFPGTGSSLHVDIERQRLMCKMIPETKQGTHPYHSLSFRDTGTRTQTKQKPESRS